MNSSRKLAAILFADIAGYTATMQQNEQQAMAMLNHYQQVLKSVMEAHQGEVIKNFGDGSICILPTVSGAVKCAIQIQEAMQETPKVPLRIGLHLGDVIQKDGDVYGDAVNIASRIESIGVPGNILVSRSFYQKVRNQPGIQFTSLGSFEFKNVEEPMEVYALSNEGYPVPARKQLQGKFKAGKKGIPTWLKVLSPIIILAIIGISYWSQLDRPTELSDNPYEVSNSIAILPFENVSHDTNQDYLAKGLSIELGNLLSRIPTLKVVPSRYLIDVKLSPNEIREEYGVNYILNGATLNKGDFIEINVELVNTTTGVATWSEKFRDTLTQILTLQDRIIRELGSELRFKLQGLTLIDQDPKNAEVYLNWLQYVNLDFYTTQSKEKYFREVEFLTKAFQVDSTYLPVLDGFLENNQWQLVWKLIGYDEYKSRYEFYLEKMSKIDEKSKFTLWRSALYERDINLDFQKAYTLFTELVNIRNIGVLFYSGGGFQLARFDIKEGKRIVEEAMKRDPFYIWNYHNLAKIYFWEGRFEESKEMWKKYGEMIGNSQLYDHQNVIIKWLLREPLQDLNQWDSIMGISDVDLIYGRALNSGIKGDIGEFESSMKNYINEYGQDNIEIYYIASIYAHLGYSDEAFDWLHEAWNKRSVELSDLKVDPFFKPLHSDPRWPAFLKKIGFPEELLD